ncbi:DUF3526 domain-containing protein [Shewanella sp. WXL01]|uniref:DUF3526 domain-containing protein n=1 Tax=Shewanella maritima TaxID=2520507 RepID=A0A411PK65_9GAMM|nr:MULTISPECIES: DUF3526 domain-containing protein [Shewanella]NKF50814.1 DUF3526 domain-containing protein [Shewanella sp. WXL01]QBF83800.1 DUF3526 domain-containing protein [Shewanella maritima]
MTPIKLIMADEWRFWKRTRLAVSVIFMGIALTLVAAIVNTVEMQHATHEREHLQHTSESRFLEQPDRHPHRMVHYGHYVFRTPAPLSIIEPGVDDYSGSSIFLEGHKQNTPMFAEQGQASGMTHFSNLTPSFLLQVIVPLFIILVGYASITREKEAGTLNIMLTQGVSLWSLMLGKLFALAGSGLLMLVPLVIAVIWAASNGEALLTSLSFVFGYLVYILIWSGIVIAASAMHKRSSASFTTLVGLWIVLCILTPRIASTGASAIAPTPGKLETDFIVTKELEKLGNGHNVSDPAFDQLKQELFSKYNVDKIEDLPFNFRGTAVQIFEEKLTTVLNEFAEQRMAEELNQALIARQFGWLSPTTAMRSLSMVIAGSSIETHHRFLREAETLRYDFVQSLNKIQTDDMTYEDDMKGYDDPASRVESSNWELLSTFSFKPDSASTRVARSLPYAAQLLFWLLLVGLSMRLALRRVS